MARRTIEKQEVLDIITGGVLLGTGGGGSAKIAEKMAEDITEVELITADDIHDEAKVLVVSGMGSPAVILTEGWKGQEIPALEKYIEVTGEEIDYLVAVETGGGALVTTLRAGCLKGIPVIDGDGAGRAIPQIETTMFALKGVSPGPIALADSKGNTAVLYPTDYSHAEKMARAITTAYGMMAGIAQFPMSGEKLKEAVIPGTLTRTEKVGKAIREAIESGQKPVDAALKSIDGVLLARGEVTNKTEESKGGFDFGRVFLKEAIVDFKNENMVVWKGDRPIAVVPDLICWLTTDGRTLTNSDIQIGMDVVAIGTRPHEKWRGPDGFDVFREILNKIGYEGEYIPMDV